MIANQVNVTSKTEIANSNKIVKVIAIMAANNSTSFVPVDVINLIQGNGVTVLQYPPNSINVFIFSHNNNLGIKISSNSSLSFHIFIKK